MFIIQMSKSSPNSSVKSSPSSHSTTRRRLSHQRPKLWFPTNLDLKETRLFTQQGRNLARRSASRSSSSSSGYFTSSPSSPLSSSGYSSSSSSEYASPSPRLSPLSSSGYTSSDNSSIRSLRRNTPKLPFPTNLNLRQTKIYTQSPAIQRSANLSNIRSVNYPVYKPPVTVSKTYQSSSSSFISSISPVSSSAKKSARRQSPSAAAPSSSAKKSARRQSPSAKRSARRRSPSSSAKRSARRSPSSSAKRSVRRSPSSSAKRSARRRSPSIQHVLPPQVYFRPQVKSKRRPPQK